MRRPVNFTWLWLSAILLLAGTLAGCGEIEHWLRNDFRVGPNYARPVAPVSDHWIEFNDPRVLSNIHQVDHEAWWHSFGDPMLDSLIESASQQNLPLRVAGMRVLQAQAERAIAAGQLLPQSQEATGQFQHVQFSRAGNLLGIPMLPVRAVDLWSTGFNASWELDLWGRIRRNLESADANIDVAVEDYDDVLVTLFAETATAYVELRAFQQRLDYARANVVAQQGSLSIAQSRFNNGLTSELDVTQARSNLAQTQALIPVLNRGARQANNRLCRLLGIPTTDLTGRIGTAAIPTAPSEVVVGIPADLLRRRPDVRKAERQVAAQSAQIGVALADLFPAFSINGSLTWQASKFDQLFSSAASGGNIGPVFNWKILNYGRIQNNVLAQDAQFQALAIAYQQKVLEANAEVEDAIVGFLESQALVHSLAESVAATERSVEIVVTQYRGGVTDFNRVFNLQSALVEQQDQLSAARAEVAVSLIGAYRALGGGWQIRLQGESYRVYDTPAVVSETPALPQPSGIRGPSRLIIPEPI